MNPSVNVIRHCARLTIVKVELTAVLLAYAKGKYERPAEKKSKIETRRVVSLIQDVLSESPNDPRFWYLNYAGDRIVIAKSGYEDAAAFKAEKPVTDARCFYCTQAVERPIGYPVNVAKESVVSDGKYVSTTVFWTEGRFCNTSCGMAYLDRCNLAGRDEYRNMLYLMATLIGDKDPRAANPMELLKCNGGVMEPHEWAAGPSTYKRSDDVLRIPLQRHYIMDARRDTF